MLFRHILGYVPASVVPALAALATVSLFSRLVEPAEYGAYALAITVSLVCQAVVFSWLQVGAVRFHAAAERDDRAQALLRAVHGAFLVSVGLFAGAYGAAMLALPLPGHLHEVLWLALPLSVVRSLVAVNLAFHRAAMKVGRYTLLESGQAVLGLALAAVFVVALDMGAVGMVLGPLAAAAAMALPDLPAMARALAGGRPDLRLAREIGAFGLPLAASFALQFVLSASDRLMIEAFLGSAVVGVYAVSYGLTERAMMSVFLVVTAAAFPLAVRALETEGADAARRQMAANGTALLGLALPACVGMVMLAGPIAEVLIGAEFRSGAVAIIPWIAVAALFAGLQAHYFDHSFHLARRTWMFVLAAGPAAVLNVALNAVLLPRMGLTGAVAATVLAYAAALAGSIFWGRRAFRLDFPFLPLAKAAAATSVMAAALHLAALPPTAMGLAAAIATGAGAYGAAALALDLGGIRAALRRLASRQTAPLPEGKPAP